MCESVSFTVGPCFFLTFFPYLCNFPPPTRLWFWGTESFIQMLCSGEQGILAEEQWKQGFLWLYFVLSGWNFLRTVPFLPTPSSVCLGSCQHVTCFCRVCVGIMLAGWVLLVLDAWPTLPYTFTRGHKCQIVLDHVHLPLTACGSNMEPTKSLSWHFWRVSLLFKSWWRKMPSHLLWLLIIF